MCESTEGAEMHLPMTAAAPGAARELARASGCAEHGSGKAVWFEMRSTA